MNHLPYLKNKADIVNWLEFMHVKNYHIHDDGVVDVDGKVRLFKEKLTYLPIQFGTVTGSFSCQGNQLTSLKGSPYSVGEDFICCDNQLTSLEFLPLQIGGSLHMEKNKITQLKNIPLVIYGDFDCSHNLLTSLKGAPGKLYGDFNCSNNQLTSLMHGPRHVEGDYACGHNQLNSLKGISRYIGKDFYCINRQGHIKELSLELLPEFVGQRVRILQENPIRNIEPLIKPVLGLIGQWLDLEFIELNNFLNIPNIKAQFEQMLNEPEKSYKKCKI